MRMDNSQRWGPFGSPEPVVVDLKATVVGAPAHIRNRPVRRESTSSSAGASAITTFSISSASSSKLSVDTSKSEPAASVICTGPADTLGSFAPTTPVASTLRALLPPRVNPLRRLVASLYVAPEPPRPAGPSPDAFVIPAICRTASSGPLEQSFAVPASPSPSTHRKQDWTPLVRRSAKHMTAFKPTAAAGPPAAAARRSSLDPALAAVEDASRLRTQCVCTTCGASGANFPRCPRSGDAWCSRECRIAAKAAAMRGPRPERPRVVIPV